MHNRPRLVRSRHAAHRRPVGINGGEYAAGPHQAGHFGEGGDRLHPMHGLHGHDDVGASVRESSRIAYRRAIRDIGHRSLLGTIAHVGVRLHADDGPSPCRRPSGREPCSAPEVDHIWSCYVRIGTQHRTERGWRRRPMGVVEISKSGEPIGVGGVRHDVRSSGTTNGPASVACLR